MNGWVKLHRQVLENEIWRHDKTAWNVFEGLLLLANSKGQWSGGRKQLAELLWVNENTLYNALQRLEEQQMVNRLVNRRYTVYSICNWSDYQAGRQQTRQQSVNNWSTTGQHSYKNKNKNKNKEIKKLATEMSEEERLKKRKKIAEIREQFMQNRSIRG